MHVCMDINAKDCVRPGSNVCLSVSCRICSTMKVIEIQKKTLNGMEIELRLYPVIFTFLLMRTHSLHKY